MQKMPDTHAKCEYEEPGVGEPFYELLEPENSFLQ